VKRKPAHRVAVRATVRINAYAAIRDRLEHVGASAVRRWLKHRDTPRLSEADIQSLGERVTDEVMVALGEILVWGER
jgi:hypothetical protein